MRRTGVRNYVLKLEVIYACFNRLKQTILWLRDEIRWGNWWLLGWVTYGNRPPNLVGQGGYTYG